MLPFVSLTLHFSVLTVLDLWLHSHHVEVKDAPLLDRMREFAMSIQRSSPAPTLGASAQRLAELIDNAVSISPYDNFRLCS
jgi:hypothetical protein